MKKKSSTKSARTLVRKKSKKKEIKKVIPQDNNIPQTFQEKQITRLESIHKMYKATHSIHDAIAYWTFIGTVVLTNALISFILIFLIVLLADPMIYIVVGIMGLGFGMIYAHILHGMSHIMEYHHWHAKSMIAVTGLINGLYIYSSSSLVRHFFGMEPYTIHMIGIPIAYYVCYLVPYFVIAIQKKSASQSLYN